MLTEVIFDLIFGIVYAVVDLMPELEMSFVGSMAGLYELIGYTTFLLPWTAIKTSLGLLLTFYTAKTTMSVLNFGLKKIPGVS